MKDIKMTDEKLEIIEALKQTEEALSWLCGALRDQAAGHPETLAMWNSTETVRRIEQARAVLKKHAEGATYAMPASPATAWRDSQLFFPDGDVWYWEDEERDVDNHQYNCTCESCLQNHFAPYARGLRPRAGLPLKR